MTNQDLAELRDPEHRQAGWWRDKCPSCGILGNPKANTMDHHDDCIGGAPCVLFTGPDWHADDLACFRDWRPVLLATGYCIYSDSHGFTRVFKQGYQWFGDQTIGTGRNSYRAAILAAVAWLAEHKPALLREAIARVEEGK